jgi:copper chaperone
MKQSYKVEGMSCGGCVASVTKAIQAVAPGTEVEVQLDGGVVTVTGQVELALVKQAVEGAGFGFGGGLD